jgi:DNA-directed RNA polymerase subunit M/transcription elongation factor TFIIS
MPVKVKCRGCQKVLTAPDKARGKTLACPDCGEKIKVPAGDGDAPPAKRKADKPEKSAKKPKDDDDFLSGLKVEHLEAEHGEERVCPYCAADMDPEDPVCGKCGMNIETGRKDAQMAKKLSRKGPDPALFYSTAWSDSWEFLMKHWRLAARTGGIWTLFLTVAFACPFMIMIWVYPPFSEGPLAPEPDAPPVHGEVVMVRSKVP